MDILKETFTWLTLLDAESIMKAYRDCRVFNFCCVSISLLDDELLGMMSSLTLRAHVPKLGANRKWLCAVGQVTSKPVSSTVKWE